LKEIKMELSEIAVFLWRRMISRWSERSLVENIFFFIIFLYFASLFVFFAFLFFWGVLARLARL